MRCGVCGRPGHRIKAVNYRGSPMPDIGIACEVGCAALLWEAQAHLQPTAPTPFDLWQAAELAWRWRARRAEVLGLPFTEPPPRSPSELAIERTCLLKWGRLPEDLIAQTSAEPTP